MKKILLAAILFICLLTVGCTKNNHPTMKKIDKVKYHYINLDEKTVDYLKNRSDYSVLFKQNKKIVIYAHCDYCPYIKRIENAVDELSKRPEYKDCYVFYLQNAPGYKTFDSTGDMKAFTKFFNKCSTFCIVNPNTNEMFTVTGDRTQFALNTHYILDRMMRW